MRKKAGCYHVLFSFFAMRMHESQLQHMELWPPNLVFEFVMLALELAFI